MGLRPIPKMHENHGHNYNPALAMRQLAAPRQEPARPNKKAPSGAFLLDKSYPAPYRTGDRAAMAATP